MPKNDFLDRIAKEKDLAMKYNTLINEQMNRDYAVIALNRHFGFGEKRAAEFLKTFTDVQVEYSRMMLKDHKDDKHFCYTKGKLDGELKEILGDYFVPFEMRYPNEARIDEYIVLKDAMNRAD